jgi:hypothetical protein
VTCLVHLGFVLDTVRCTFGIPAAKVEKILGKVKQLMGCMRRNRRQAQRTLVAIFVGVCASLSPSISDARLFSQG